MLTYYVENGVLLQHSDAADTLSSIPEKIDEDNVFAFENIDSTRLELVGLLRSIVDSNAKLDGKVDHCIKMQEEFLQRMMLMSNNVKPSPALLPPETLQPFECIDTIADIVAFEDKLINEQFVQEMASI